MSSISTQSKIAAIDSRGARQDQRRTESRQRLLAAARQLFVERGYHDTRPQDISRLAGVGHGTFYLYFSDKQACFRAFVEQAQAEVDSLILKRLAVCRTHEERVYGVLEVSMDFTKANPGVLKAAWAGHQLMSSDDPGSATSPSIVEQWAERWAEVITRGQKAGLIWDDYDPKIIGYAVLMVTSVVSTGTREAWGDKEHFLTNLTRFVLRGLTAPGAGGALSS
ncbi:MAG TPA: TetR/AcrR family transcriptional regulator [Alphaproteobacteria bacterium]|nr:TetR/AcrR family transcriptional regulator [Alphaproteobacteria bacterium]